MNEPQPADDQPKPICSCDPSHRHELVVTGAGGFKAVSLVCIERGCENVECWRKTNREIAKELREAIEGGPDYVTPSLLSEAADAIEEADARVRAARSTLELLQDKLEEADDRIYMFLDDMQRCANKGLEAKIAQIREVMDSEARDAISWRKIRSIIDAPASEGKTL